MTKYLTLIALVLMPINIYAETMLGIDLDIGTWNASIDGEIVSENSPQTLPPINMSTLGIDQGQQNNHFSLSLRHPLTPLPNIKFAYTAIGANATETLSNAIIFADNNYAAATEVTSEIDFTITDLTFFYRIDLAPVSIDLGLTARKVSGDLSITEAGAIVSPKEEIDGTIPMLHMDLQFNIPGTSLRLGAQANYSGNGDDSFSDYIGKLSIVSDGWGLDLGIDLGYRIIEIESSDESSLQAALDVGGPFIALLMRF
ncbi:MAG: hypothetical protein COA42_02575 [Alteromonadaceae bacterium]|nr:MAG: hypothetical protein COA42_02575 [Alteromonadaceae bacterium]